MSEAKENLHIIYGDTDSVYLQLMDYADIHGIDPGDMVEDVDEDGKPVEILQAIQIADRLQEKLQTDLAPIIGAKFATPPEYISILEPGREVVARKGLFKDRKKRYALHIVNNEGFGTDKLKIMGMETQRSDTPAFIQDFLTECIEKVVKHDIPYAGVKEYVEEFRKTYRAMDPWRRGSPGRVKNLGKATLAFDDWEQKISRGVAGAKLPQMHVTVKAALSTNRLMKLHGETRWGELRDGDKVEVIYLKPNDHKLDCVAIPTGETYVPEWFQELPFDSKRMEEKLINRKLFNVIGDILDWDFTPPKTFAEDVIKRMEDFYD